MREDFTLDQFDLLLRYELSISREDIAVGENYQVIMFRALENLEDEHSIERLIRAASAQRPASEELSKLVRRLSIDLDLDPADDQNSDSAGRTIVPLNRQIPPRRSFFGRQAETLALQKALSSSRGTVVIIRGLPGIGKTALAHSVAERMEQKHFEAVVWYPGGSRNASYGNLLDAVARVLDYPYEFNREPLKRREALVRGLLEGHRCLLVVDDYDSIPGSDLEYFLTELPPGTVALVTAQALPKFNDAWSEPPLAGLDQKATRSLIMDAADRLSLSRKDLRPYCEAIYAATEGAPKAVEWVLALARETGDIASVLESIENAQGELFDELFPRLWSSLSVPSQQVVGAVAASFGRLSRDAICEMTGYTRGEIAKSASELNARSLLVVDPRTMNSGEFPRYILQPLVRTYALSSVGLEGVVSYEDRLCEYIRSFTSRYGGGADSENWENYDKLDRERRNAFGILEWCVRNGDNRRFPILKSIVRYMFAYGYWEQIEALGALVVAGDCSADAVDDAASIELARARVRTHQARFADARASIQEARKYLLDARGSPTEFWLVFVEGELAYFEGRYDSAHELWSDARGKAQSVGTEHDVVGLDYWLAVVAFRNADFEDARTRLLANLRRCGRMKWERLEALHLYYLGRIALDREVPNLPEARRRLVEAYKLVRTRDARTRAQTELALARLESACGEIGKALKWAKTSHRHALLLGMEGMADRAARLAHELTTGQGGYPR